ncbi:MAG: YraN family protein, partial [Puniceicoccales bacterium]|nr:YraN family protein [Puniceicoccales bacterium]
MSCLAKGFQKRCGLRGENLAAVFLEEKGFQITHRNWRYSHKEIDLIAQEEEITVFIEVRVRSDKALVPGFESLTKKKRMALKQASLAFLAQRPQVEFYRWDVMEYRTMDVDFQRYEVAHYENV